MRWKRLFYYLSLNILVSACTVLLVLYAWETYRPLEAGSEPVSLGLALTATASGAATAGPDENSSAEPSGPAAPTATRPPDFIDHVVRPGDTLSGLAQEYDVAVELILAANELENPDSLDVGDVIRIPLAGTVPQPSATESPVLSATPPPPATLQPTLDGDQVGEPVLEIFTVIGAGDLAEERVVVQQRGDGEVSLQGWKLLGPEPVEYVFPQLVLFPDGAVTVFTKAGADSVAELHWGLEAAIWGSGEVVTLVDPEGNLVAAYQVP